LSQQTNPRGPRWLLYALGGFLFFGLTNFLLGAIAEMASDRTAASISAPMLVWLGMGLLGIGAAVRFRASGRGFAGIPAPRFAVLAAVAGISLAAGMLTLKIGLAADSASRGPIVAITSCNSALVAVLAWVVLRERLSRTQLGGLGLVLGGIVILAAGSSSRASVTGFLFGAATMLLFGVTNFLLKYCGHHGTDSIRATAVLWLSGGACGALALTGTYAVGRGLAGLDTPLLEGTALTAGLLLGAGMLMVKLAVTRGPAGPAAAIIGSNAVLVTLLEWMVFGHVPPLVKLAGMAVSMGGIFLLALAGLSTRPSPKTTAVAGPHPPG
jgi:bacterial/archaeal transporter family protein